MIVFTLSELRTIMRQAAGEVDPGTEVADVRYADLGYDSLALLEITAKIKQCLGVEVPDAPLWSAALTGLVAFLGRLAGLHVSEPPPDGPQDDAIF